MKFYKIDPDVPGFLHEPRKIAKNDLQLPLIHYVFECWPEADLIQAHPVFLVSARLATALAEAKLSGYELKKCVGIKGEQFDIASPGYGELPIYSWLVANGKAGLDDFGVSDHLMLVVSQTAIDVMQDYNLMRANICPF